MGKKAAYFMYFGDGITDEKKEYAQKLLKSIIRFDPEAELLPEGWQVPYNKPKDFEGIAQKELLKEWATAIQKEVKCDIIKIEKQVLEQ